jgi:hypothetical protein
MEFPRTTVGGVSLPRLIAGTNWFLGYSHTSQAKDRFIKELQSRERIADVLAVFLEHGVDAVMAPLSQHLEDAIQMAEDRSGRRMIRIRSAIGSVRVAGSDLLSAPSVRHRCADRSDGGGDPRH